MKNFLTVPFLSANASVLSEDGCLLFRAEGPQLTGTQYEFTSAPVTLEQYLVLEYRILGIRRHSRRRSPLIWARRGEEELPLACYDDLSMDNAFHTLAVKVPEGEFDGLIIRFGIDRRTRADFALQKLYTCAADELPQACESLFCKNVRAYRPIDLSAQYNKSFSLADADHIIDGGRFFDTHSVCLQGIPFRVQPEGLNLIAPPPPPAENEDIILNFGVPARRRLCRPISRDTLITVPIHGPAREIFFLMSLSGRRHQRWNYDTQSTILGEPFGEVGMPLTVCDVEGFMAEIVYADGRRDTAMPMHLGLQRHVVQGDISAYAVPADGTMVESVIFHNRLLDTDCDLIAVTVNETQTRQYSHLLNPQPFEPLSHTVRAERSICLADHILRLNNGALSMQIDISHAMTLLEMQNDYAPAMHVRPAPMLRLLDEHRTEYSGIALKDAIVSESGATVFYTCPLIAPVETTLEMAVQIDLGEKDDICFRLSVTNTGREETRFAVVFPAVSGLTFGSREDDWYFLPKYQEHVSNETIWMYEESAPSFPLQYLDVFSPAQQGGLALTTRERDVLVRKYAFEKDESDMAFRVEYPHMYGQLPAGQTFLCSPTLLTAHEGDWRAAFRLYFQWLHSWYQPYKCQDKQWYRECFWLLAEITDFFETEEFTRFPIWYDQEKDHFNFLDIMEEQKSLTGFYPDILHLWAWCYYEDRHGQQWGNYSTQDYDIYGGLENFRRALHEVKEKTGSQVSLYLHPTLLSARYPQAKELFPRLRVINEHGNYISILQDSFRMCHANEEWRDRTLSMYPRVYSELGIPLLYVDEFSLRVENRCYAPNHGHCVPSNLLKTDRDFITRLKANMPEEVVLYGEYAPVDINAGYIDCNISYSYLDSIVDLIETAWRAGDGDDRLSRVYVDTYRFAFPGLVQLILPMAMRNLSWHPQKFFFFNGTAIYDSFWDIEESAGHAFTIHAYALKKEYADCFTSDTPETMIDTLTPVVCANRFPGKGRTLYTLYNRGYNTFRGKILRMPHTDGQTYYDVWNQKPLSVEIVNGQAEISLEMDAMQMGCIVIRHP